MTIFGHEYYYSYVKWAEYFKFKIQKYPSSFLAWLGRIINFPVLYERESKKARVFLYRLTISRMA